jgi:hypothetical protein
MNHDQRRELKKKATKALKEAKTFFLVVCDGKKMPVHYFDLTQLGADDTDIRVIAMQAAAGSALGALNTAQQQVEKRVAEEEKKKVGITGEDRKNIAKCSAPPEMVCMSDCVGCGFNTEEESTAKTKCCLFPGCTVLIPDIDGAKEICDCHKPDYKKVPR